MDARTRELPAAAIVGSAYVAPAGLALGAVPPDLATQCDVAAFLKDRKSVKLMSTQDRLALGAAAAAVRDAGLTEAELSERTGIYLAVGMLPFEQGYLDLIAEKSQKDGKLDMGRFSHDAFQAMNPLLTFKCLPNMPVFHISFNLGIHGPYFVTYPGSGQWFRALQTALEDLEAGRVDFALVGAVADQRNVLVRHHVERTGAQDPERLIDSACVLVLAREGAKAARARLRGLRLEYRPADPFAKESYAPEAGPLAVCAGPVSAPLALALRIGAGAKGSETYRFRAEDGAAAELSLEVT